MMSHRSCFIKTYICVLSLRFLSCQSSARTGTHDRSLEDKTVNGSASRASTSLKTFLLLAAIPRLPSQVHARGPWNGLPSGSKPRSRLLGASTLLENRDDTFESGLTFAIRKPGYKRAQFRRFLRSIFRRKQVEAELKEEAVFKARQVAELEMLRQAVAIAQNQTQQERVQAKEFYTMVSEKTKEARFAQQEAETSLAKAKAAQAAAEMKLQDMERIANQAIAAKEAAELKATNEARISSDLKSALEAAELKAARLAKTASEAAPVQAAEMIQAQQDQIVSVPKVVAEGHNIITIANADEYYARIEDAKRSSKSILINFSSNKCRACMAMAPKLQHLAKEFPDVQFYKIMLEDDDKRNKKLAESLKIPKFPWYELIKSGSKMFASDITIKDVELLRQSLKLYA